MIQRRIESLERRVAKLPFDPSRWLALHKNDFWPEKKAAWEALKVEELRAIKDELSRRGEVSTKAAWIKTLTDEQARTLWESGDVTTIWDYLTPEQREMIEQEIACW